MTVDEPAGGRYRWGMMLTKPDPLEEAMRFRQLVEPLAQIHASRLARHADLDQFATIFMLNDEPGRLDCARIDAAWRDAPAWCREQFGPPWSKVRHPDRPWLYTNGRLILYLSDQIAATAFRIRWG